jgi:hypothetical protein
MERFFYAYVHPVPEPNGEVRQVRLFARSVSGIERWEGEAAEVNSLLLLLGRKVAQWWPRNFRQFAKTSLPGKPAN